jgi:hypothetical protein
MYKNTVTSENTPDSHKTLIKDKADRQLVEIVEQETTEEQIQVIKDHFKWVLANDFYKDECSAEQISGMESYLPADYADDYEELPE